MKSSQTYSRVECCKNTDIQESHESETVVLQVRSLIMYVSWCRKLPSGRRYGV